MVMMMMMMMMMMMIIMMMMMMMVMMTMTHRHVGFAAHFDGLGDGVDEIATDAKVTYLDLVAVWWRWLGGGEKIGERMIERLMSD